MFSTELKFASDCLLNWFYSKNKKNELSIHEKRDYETKNPIDWESGKCQICTFPLHVNPSDNITTDNNKMSYGDFIIQKEHKFLRNIFSEEDLQKGDAIKNLESFHESFSRYLRLVIFAEKCVTTLKEFLECYFDELLEFINEHCQDCIDLSN